MFRTYPLFNLDIEAKEALRMFQSMHRGKRPIEKPAIVETPRHLEVQAKIVVSHHEEVDGMQDHHASSPNNAPKQERSALTLFCRYPHQ
jgi:hypothetical protein